MRGMRLYMWGIGRVDRVLNRRVVGREVLIAIM
jgi:hypothetical protein